MNGSMEDALPLQKPAEDKPVAFPDPDQDLLNKLDRRERRSEILSLVPPFGALLAAGGVTFGILRFGIHWSTENALDVGGLVGVGFAFLAWPRTKRHSK